MADRFRVRRGRLSDAQVARLQADALALVQRWAGAHPLHDDVLMNQNCVDVAPARARDTFGRVQKRMDEFWADVQPLLAQQPVVDRKLLFKLTHGVKSVIANYSGVVGTAYQLLMHMELLAEARDPATREPMDADEAHCAFSLLLPAVADATTQLLALVEVTINMSEQTVWLAGAQACDPAELAATAQHA